MTARYGKLTYLRKLSEKKNDGRFLHELICDCGNLVKRPMNALKRGGENQSCGCAYSEINKTHGMRGTRVYRIWKGVKFRCRNPSSKDYEKYSKLGMDRRWDRFECFFLDMGEPPTEKHQIDRIDNNAGYSKENCRWALPCENSRNRSTSYIWIVDGVEFDSISDVAKEYGVKPPVAHRWFKGYVSRGKTYPPKPGFNFRKKYDDK